MTASQPADRASARPLSPALDTTFKIGLVLKGLDGILEVVGGLLLGTRQSGMHRCTVLELKSVATVLDRPAAVRWVGGVCGSLSGIWRPVTGRGWLSRSCRRR